MKKQKFIRVIDFVQIHNLSEGSIHVGRASKNLPEYVFKKDEKELYIDEHYFVKRQKKIVNMINKAHDNYYKIIEHITEHKLATLLQDIYPNKNLHVWIVFLHRDLFRVRDESILRKRIPKSTYIFLRVSNWILKRKMHLKNQSIQKQELLSKNQTKDLKVDTTRNKDGYTIKECAKILGISKISFSTNYANKKVRRISRGLYSKKQIDDLASNKTATGEKKDTPVIQHTLPQLNNCLKPALQTEFQVTDRVYVIHKDSLQKGEISKIDIGITFESTQIIYSVDIQNGNRPIKKEECQVFGKIEDIVEKLKQQGL